MMNHRPRVLLVDNQPDDFIPVQECLEREGFSVSMVTNADDGKREMALKKADVAIIDLRLERDWDERDLSGITLAKQAEPSIPKIIWTNHPTIAAVKSALGPSLDGLPAAVGFVSKLSDEGLPALLNAIRLALTPANGQIMRRTLQAFEVKAPVALHNRVEELGPEVASERMHGLLRDMAQELERGRERDSHEMLRLRKTGIVVGWVGTATIVAMFPLLWFGAIEAGFLSAGVSTLTNLAHKLFAKRENAAQDRLTRSYMELEKIYRTTFLFALIESIESKNARDACRKKLLNHLIDQSWLFNVGKP